MGETEADRQRKAGIQKKTGKTHTVGERDIGYRKTLKEEERRDR